MIVRKNKMYEVNSLFPNVDWYENQDNYLIDESTETGKIICGKIIEHAPYYDFVFDDLGEITDIIPTERPQVVETVHIPSQEERIQSIEEVLLMLI